MFPFARPDAFASKAVTRLDTDSSAHVELAVLAAMLIHSDRTRAQIAAVISPRNSGWGSGSGAVVTRGTSRRDAPAHLPRPTRSSNLVHERDLRAIGALRLSEADQPVSVCEGSRHRR